MLELQFATCVGATGHTSGQTRSRERGAGARRACVPRRADAPPAPAAKDDADEPPGAAAWPPAHLISTAADALLRYRGAEPSIDV